jgi:hypothetical protein
LRGIDEVGSEWERRNEAGRFFETAQFEFDEIERSTGSSPSE